MPLVKPLCILLFLVLREDLNGLSDLRGKMRSADLIGGGGQPCGTLGFDTLRNLIRKVCGSGAGARGVGEYMHLGESGLTHKAERFLKIGIRFAGESDDDVRCQGGMRENPADALRKAAVFRGRRS